jgi:hypothetical protein
LDCRANAPAARGREDERARELRNGPPPIYHHLPSSSAAESRVPATSLVNRLSAAAAAGVDVCKQGARRRRRRRWLQCAVHGAQRPARRRLVAARRPNQVQRAARAPLLINAARHPCHFDLSARFWRGAAEVTPASVGASAELGRRRRRRRPDLMGQRRPACLPTDSLGPGGAARASVS